MCFLLLTPIENLIGDLVLRNDPRINGENPILKKNLEIPDFFKNHPELDCSIQLGPLPWGFL